MISYYILYLYNSHRYVDKIKDLDQIKTVKFDNIFRKLHGRIVIGILNIIII